VDKSYSLESTKIEKENREGPESLLVTWTDLWSLPAWKKANGSF